MKPHGWILFSTTSGMYVGRGCYDNKTRKDARVFPNRRNARVVKLTCDRVKKVELDNRGKPVAVIGRG